MDYQEIANCYVRADRLGTLIDAFMGAPYATMVNRHYDPDGGSDR